MICTGYLVKTSGGLTPLYEIKIDIEGNGKGIDFVMDQLKSLLQSKDGFSVEKMGEILEGFTVTQKGNFYEYVKGAQTISISIERHNLLKGLDFSTLVKSLKLKLNSPLTKIIKENFNEENVSLVFLPTAVFNENFRSSAYAQYQNNTVYIKLDQLEGQTIQGLTHDFTKFIHNPDEAEGDIKGFQSILKNIHHEILHHVILNADQFSAYRVVLNSPELWVKYMEPIVKDLKKNKKIPGDLIEDLDLYQKQDLSYAFYNELFVLVESVPVIKAIVESQYGDLLNQSPVEKETIQPKIQQIEPLYNEQDFDNDFTDEELKEMQAAIDPTQSSFNITLFKEYSKVAYLPYMKVDPNSPGYALQLQNLANRPGSIIYVQWTVDGKELHPSLNIVEDVEMHNGEAIIKVYGRMYNKTVSTMQEGKQREQAYLKQPWVPKTIRINLLENVVTSEEKGEKFVAKVLGMKQLQSSESRLLSKDGHLISRLTESKLSGILRNVTKWKQKDRKAVEKLEAENQKLITDYANTHEISEEKAQEILEELGKLHNIFDKKDVPQFYNGEWGLRPSNAKIKTPVGVYFHMDKHQSTRGSTDNVSFSHTEAISGYEGRNYASNNRNLGDSTYALLKVGDVVIYKIWNNRKGPNGGYDSIEGIIVDKYEQGLIVRNIDGDNIGDNDIIVQRSSLSKAYIFFNEKEPNLEKSKLLDDLDVLAWSLNKDNADKKGNPDYMNFLLHPKDPRDHNKSVAFRPMKQGTKTFEFETKKSSYQPSDEAIKEVYQGKNIPSKAYQEFEREASKMSYLEQKKFGETNPLFYEVYQASKNRIDFLKDLKEGAGVLIQKKSWKKISDDKYEAKSERDFVHGIIIAKSNNFLTVAIPNKHYNPASEDSQKGNFTYENFKYITINVTDHRLDQEYFVQKVYNSYQFEHNLISIFRNLYEMDKTQDMTEGERNEHMRKYIESLDKPLNLNTYEENLIGEQKMFRDKIVKRWLPIRFFDTNEFKYNEDTEQIESILDERTLQERTILQANYTSMLEVGSLVYYLSISQDKLKIINTLHVVVGKDWETGLPILAQYTKKGDGYSSIRTYVAPLNRIVGVVLLKEDITVSNKEKDGNITRTTLKASKRLETELKKLFVSYKQSLLPTIFTGEKSKLVNKEWGLDDYVEKLKKRPDIHDAWPVEVREYQYAFDPGGGQPLKIYYQYSYIIDKTNNPLPQGKIPKELKGINVKWVETKDQKERDEKGIKIHQIWVSWKNNPNRYTPYNGSVHSKISFLQKQEDGKFNDPVNLKVEEYITPGAIIQAEYKISETGATYKYGGIVIYGTRSHAIVLSTYNDELENSVDEEGGALEVSDISQMRIYPLLYKSTNIGTKEAPIYIPVISRLKSIQYTRGTPANFEILKSKVKNGAYNSDIVPDTKLVNLGIYQHADRSAIKVSQSKSGVFDNEIPQNVEELTKFQEMFKANYNIEFEILSEQEIQQRFDYLPQFNKEMVSKHRAFKYENKIIVNANRASLDQPLHEMSHFVLEALRIEKPELYQDLLSVVQYHPDYNVIKNSYPELSGTPLQEEVFSTLLGRVYFEEGSEKDKRWVKQNESLLDNLFDWLKKLLRLLSGKGSSVDFDNQEILHNPINKVLIQFGNDVVGGKYAKEVNSQTSINKEIKNLSDKLFENNNLTQYCAS